MRNGFWDRVLIYLFALLSIALAALVALQVFGVDLIDRFYGNLEAQAPGVLWKLIVLGIFAILALLGVYAMTAVTPVREKKREFINLTNDENGQVKIALPALREMARRAVGDTTDVKDMAVEISEAGDAITVDIALDIVSGVHVPTVTMNMQRDVKSYIQVNCGVAVKDVSVVINSVLPAPVPPKAYEPPKACEPPKPVEVPEPAEAPKPVETAPAEEPAHEPETEDAAACADYSAYEDLPPRDLPPEDLPPEDGETAEVAVAEQAEE